MNNDNTISAFLSPTTTTDSMEREFVDRSIVASGGYNIIVKAKRQGRWWALKGLKEEYRNQTTFQLLLRKEYDLMAGLSHAHVAAVNSFEDVEGLGHCIVMEWIEGKDLADWLADNPSSKRRLRIAHQIIYALAYIHSRQIVHRDLKPSNIMVTANGEDAKLIDFGIGDADNYAVFKQPAGTLGYISPEQCEGNKPDVRNDIYSLGCILRDMHLGIPFHGVICRCLKPIDRRYRNVEEVGIALNRSRFIPYYIIGAIMVTSLAIGIIFFLSSPPQPTNDIATITKDTLSKENMPIQQNMQTQQTPQPQAVIATKPAVVDSSRIIVKKAISNGKKILDRRMAQTDKEIRQCIDTVTYGCYIEPRLSQVISDFASFTADYAKSFRPRLDNPFDIADIQNLLLLYLKERYYDPWGILLEEKRLPYRPRN